MKKITCIVLVLILLFAVGCTSSGEAVDPPAEEPEGGSPADVPSVALLLNGPISDMGWNASAYNALMKIEEIYGAQVSYAEKVSQSDMGDMFRSYAEQGYDMIYGHGSQFMDACLSVHMDYPEVQFVIINGPSPTEPNVACTQIADDHQGYLMGAFAALMTETGTVGIVGGLELPPITNAIRGFEAAVASLNPDAKVLSAMTGSFDDAAAAKETAIAFINEGADYVGAVAAAAGMGAIEGCQEEGVCAIGGAGGDQSAAAPDTVAVSVIKDISVPFLLSYEKYMAGELKPEISRFGVGEGAVYYSPYHNFEDRIPDGVQQKLDEVIQGLSDGSITVPDIAY